MTVFMYLLWSTFVSTSSTRTWAFSVLSVHRTGSLEKTTKSISEKSHGELLLGYECEAYLSNLHRPLNPQNNLK